MRNAVRHLRAADPVIRAVIDRVGPCRFERVAEGSHDQQLARMIVYQQLSTKAARTIYARVCALVGGRAPTSAEILALPDHSLRGAGISTQKVKYLRELAGHATSGTVEFDALEKIDDDLVIRELTKIKGIGRWTAEMFLMFRLGRTDVFPVGDLGIKKAMQRAFELRRIPSARSMLQRAEPWRPFRTIACWYLWRSLDAAGGEL